MTRSKSDPKPKSKEKDDIVFVTGRSDPDPDADAQELELEEDAPCRVCDVDVTKTTDGLKCDRCKGWVHPHKECSDLTKLQFKFMKGCKNPAIQYICMECRDLETDDANPRDAVARDAIAHNSAKIDLLGGAVKQLQKQNNEILNYMKLKSKTDDSIKLQVTEAVKIEKDREERKFNLILYNIQESDSGATSAQAEIEDLQNVKNVFAFVCPSVETSGITSKSVTRCGNRRVPNEEFPDPKPRPIKVVLQSPSDVLLIRKNARKLKDNEGFKHVGISEDKTYQERMEYRQLRIDLQKRRDNGDDVVIYNGEVKLRSDLPNHKRSVDGATGGPRAAAHTSAGAVGSSDSRTPK